MYGIRCHAFVLICLWVLHSGADARVHPDPEPQDPDHAVSSLRDEIIWSYTAPEDNGDINSPRALDDIDGDGVMDIVACIYDAGYGYDDLLCFSGASEEADILWSIDSQQGASGGGGYGQECIDIMPDVDGDGIRDVLYGTAWGGRTVYCRSGATGDLIWYLDTYELPNSGWVYDVSPYVDLNNDGIAEAVAAVGIDTKAVFCINGASSGSAEILWSYFAPDGFLTLDTIEDIDGDGFNEVIAGNGTNYEDDRVFCLRGDPQWTGYRTLWSFHTGGVVRSVLSTTDTNGDDIEDVIAGSGSNSVYCLSGMNGSIIWSRNLYHDIMKVAALGDVTGDAIPEILVGASTNAVYCLNGSSGSVLWSTPTGSTNGGYVWTVAGLNDIDGDGLHDAVAGSFDTRIYLLRGADGLVLGTYSTGRRLYGVASVPDLDNDGYDDVLGGTQGLYGSQASLYCLSGGSFAPLRPDVSLNGTSYTIAWTPFPDTDSYWIFGEANMPCFTPVVDVLTGNRITILPDSQSQWTTDLGLNSVDAQWTFLVMSVDENGDEIVRSRFVGEYDFQLAIP